MDNKVFVVTCPELGWDCVVGVFQGLTKEQLKETFPSPEYVLSEFTIETNVENYD